MNLNPIDILIAIFVISIGILGFNNGFLKNNNSNNLDIKPSTEIYVTDKKSNFKKLATTYLNLSHINIELLKIS